MSTASALIPLAHSTVLLRVQEAQLGEDSTKKVYLHSQLFHVIV